MFIVFIIPSVQGRSVTTLTGGVQHPGFTDEHVALQAHLAKFHFNRLVLPTPRIITDQCRV